MFLAKVVKQVCEKESGFVALKVATLQGADPARNCLQSGQVGLQLFNDLYRILFTDGVVSLLRFQFFSVHSDVC